MVNAARIAVGILLLSAGVVSAQPADSAILRGDSPQTRKRLAEAERKIADGKAAEAAEDLQRLLDEAGDDLVVVEGRQHRAARAVAHQILAKLPPDALKTYRARVDEPARKLLDAAKRDRDPKPLWRLLDRYFTSRPAEEALLLLGDWLYERGEFHLAEEQWNRLLPDADEAVRYPGSQTDAAALRARIVLASHARNDPQAPESFATFAKLHPDAKGSLAGKTGLYAETLRERMSKPRVAIEATNREWPAFGNDPGRSAALPGVAPVRFATKPLWTAGLPPPEPFAFPNRSVPSRPPFGHPVIADGWVYVSDGARVLGYELASGALKIVYPPGNPASDRRATDPPSCPTLAAAHGRIYARFGAPVLRAADATKTPSSIVCLDPSAKPALRLVWSLKPPAAEGRAAGVWEGAPLLANGKLWAVFSRIEGGRIAYSVACYDPADADEAPERPAWVVEVCECPLPAGADQARGRMELLALAGRNIVFHSNAGAAVALEADSGNRAWAFQYPRATKRLLDAHRSWESAPAVASDGRVFIAPADGERVYALDAETGRELWESGPVEGARILGVARNRVVISTEGPIRSLRGLGVETGSARSPEGWVQSAGLGYGQGFVTDSAVFWPSREGLYFLDPESGNPIRTAPPLMGGLFGNLAFADGALVSVTTTEVRAFRPIAPPFIRPDDVRNRFSWLLEKGRFEEAARGEFPNSLRAMAAVHLEEPIPELRDEWIVTPLGEVMRYGTWVDRRAGKAEPARGAPGTPWSAADRAALDAPSLTADAEASVIARLPAGCVPLVPIRGSKPPSRMIFATATEALAFKVEDDSRATFALEGSFTHAADLADGFVLAGRFAVAVYGAKREATWVFRVPDLEPLPMPELTSFNLAGEWLFARLGDRHLIALDLKAGTVAWVLGAHGSTRFEPLAFGPVATFAPELFVSERLLAVQRTDGTRWLVQASTGAIKGEAPTSRTAWVAAPAEAENRIAFADGPGTIRFVGWNGKPKFTYRVDGESSFTGEPPQTRRFGELLIATVRRNIGVELVRLDPLAGTAEWSTPAFLEAGRVHLDDWDTGPQRVLIPIEGTLAAINVDDGTLAWRVKLPFAARWTVRAGRTVGIAIPTEAIPDEPFEPAWIRLRDSFLREPNPARLPWLVAALFDTWCERAVPVVLFDLESGKRLKTIPILARGPNLVATFEGDTALIATADRLVRLK